MLLSEASDLHQCLTASALASPRFRGAISKKGLLRLLGRVELARLEYLDNAAQLFLRGGCEILRPREIWRESCLHLFYRAESRAGQTGRRSAGNGIWRSNPEGRSFAGLAWPYVIMLHILHFPLSSTL